MLLIEDSFYLMVTMAGYLMSAWFLVTFGFSHQASIMLALFVAELPKILLNCPDIYFQLQELAILS